MLQAKKTGARNGACLRLIILLFITVCIIGMHRTMGRGKKLLVPKGVNLTEFVASDVNSISLSYYIGYKIDEVGLACSDIFLPANFVAYQWGIRITDYWKDRPKKLIQRIKSCIAFASYPRKVKRKSYKWRISDSKQRQILRKYGQYCHRIGDYAIVILKDDCIGKRSCYMYFNHRFIVIGPKNL